MSIGRFTLLLILILPVASYAVTYRYVDQNGVVHYSDRPIEGAEEVELPGAQTFSDTRPRRSVAPTRSTPTQAPAASPTVGTANYDGFEIIQPAHDTTIWNSGGQVEVVVGLTPSLRTGHRLRLFLDGEQVEKADTTTTLVLDNVERGTHELRGVVEDAAGNPVARTEVNTFHYRQTFIRRN